MQDDIFQRGVKFAFSTSVADLAGFSFEFDCHASLLLPHATASDMSSFLTNPLGALEFGISLGGSVVLPYGIGQAAVAGVLSATLFEINASASFHMSGLDFSLSAPLHLDSEDASLSLFANATLPIIGFVEFDGAASTTAGFSLHVAFNVHLLLIQLQGDVSISVPSSNTLSGASISASGAAAFCLLGTASFSGSLSSIATTYSYNLLLVTYS